MKNKLLSILMIFSLLLSVLPTTGCAKESILQLNVYNWEDYIACEDFDMIAEFEAYYEQTHGVKIKVNYSTFGTNENMYNELKLTQKKNGDYSYDLVCPSEYMIQKMIEEQMLEEFDMQNGQYTSVSNYEANVSPMIKTLFTENGWDKYATVFNWGTMGFTYNPDYVEYDDVKSWSVAWDKDYANKITIKDSVRDSYILALGHAYKDKLNALKTQYDVLSKEYNEAVGSILNDFSDTAIEDSGKVLKEVKKNIYGFEVDSGKQDMATGKLYINFAWSGDSVFSMDIAEEEGTYLEYVVPEEGSNIFFDGWVMPKGANKQLAQEFLNFMYEEENAIENLDYICYSSPIVGEKVFDYVCNNYGLTTVITTDEESKDCLADEDGNYYTVGGKYLMEVYVADAPDFIGEGNYTIYWYDEESNSLIAEETEVLSLNVKHFFGDHISGDGTIYTDSLSRQLATMYPTEEIINRCVVMEHISSDKLKKLNNMWESVKVGYMSPSLMISIVVLVVLLVVLTATLIILKKKGIYFHKKQNPNLKLVKSEEIKRY